MANFFWLRGQNVVNPHGGKNILYPRKSPLSFEKSLRGGHPICGKVDTEKPPNAPPHLGDMENAHNHLSARKRATTGQSGDKTSSGSEFSAIPEKWTRSRRRQMHKRHHRKHAFHANQKHFEAAEKRDGGAEPGGVRRR